MKKSRSVFDVKGATDIMVFIRVNGMMTLTHSNSRHQGAGDDADPQTEIAMVCELSLCMEV